jgi:hypothetical protein
VGKGRAVLIGATDAPGADGTQSVPATLLNCNVDFSVGDACHMDRDATLNGFDASHRKSENRLVMLFRNVIPTKTPVEIALPDSL